MDFDLFEGRRRKLVKEETRIMFEKYNNKYYPSYIINESTSSGFWNELEIAGMNQKDTFNMKTVSVFFTKRINPKTKDFVADCQFFHEINPNAMNPAEQTEDDKTDFMLETGYERQLLKRHWEAKR
jgi:hypothetical protein